jgi:hypothetical protein
MSKVVIQTGPYAEFPTHKFDNTYDRNNYGAYDANALQKQNYNPSLISQDQYGEAYDVSDPNLAGFAERLKKTKKSRFTETECGVTYGEFPKS